MSDEPIDLTRQQRLEQLEADLPRQVDELIGSIGTPSMTCEICDTQPATMWVVGPLELLVSCDDCGPQLGYKILAPLVPSST